MEAFYSQICESVDKKCWDMEIQLKILNDKREFKGSSAVLDALELGVSVFLPFKLDFSGFFFKKWDFRYF